MMCEIPLTPEQQLFATENHDLVYKFLNEKQLPVDEFYDVVIFGYINSIHRFFTTPGLTKPELFMPVLPIIAKAA